MLMLKVKLSPPLLLVEDGVPVTVNVSGSTKTTVAEPSTELDLPVIVYVPDVPAVNVNVLVVGVDDKETLW